MCILLDSTKPFFKIILAIEFSPAMYESFYFSTSMSTLDIIRLLEFGQSFAHIIYGISLSLICICLPDY